MNGKGIPEEEAWNCLGQTNPVLSIRGLMPPEFGQIISMVYKKMVDPGEVWRDVIVPWAMAGLEEASAKAMSEFNTFRMLQAGAERLDPEYYLRKLPRFVTRGEKHHVLCQAKIYFEKHKLF